MGIPLVTTYPSGVSVIASRDAAAREAEMTIKNEYRVTGMSCGHCEAAVRGEVSKLAGVESLEVSAATGVLVVESRAPLSDDEVFAAVDEAGYEAARI